MSDGGYDLQVTVRAAVELEISDERVDALLARLASRGAAVGVGPGYVDATLAASSEIDGLTVFCEAVRAIVREPLSARVVDAVPNDR